MENSEPIVSVIRYPSSFNIRQLHGLTVSFPNAGKILLKLKDSEEMVELGELEAELEKDLLPRLKLLEKSKGDRQFKFSGLRVHKILKLRKCPLKRASGPAELKEKEKEKEVAAAAALPAQKSKKKVAAN